MTGVYGYGTSTDLNAAQNLAVDNCVFNGGILMLCRWHKGINNEIQNSQRLEYSVRILLVLQTFRVFIKELWLLVLSNYACIFGGFYYY